MINKVVLIIIAATFCSAGGSLPLKSAQELLFANNLELKALSVDTSIAKDSIRVVRAAFYPSLDLLFNYNFISEQNSIILPLRFPGMSSNIVKLRGQNKLETGADLSWPVFTGLSRYNSERAAQTGLELKRLSVQTLKNRLSYNLGVTYVRWLLMYRIQNIKQELVDQLTEQSAQIHSLYKGGVVQKVKALDADARVQASKSDLLTAMDQTDSIKIELLLMLHSSDSSIVPADTAFAFDSVGIPSMVDTARPEIKTLQYAIEKLQWGERVLFGTRLSQVFTVAGYRWARPGLQMGSGDFMGYGLVGVQARWNLFDGFRYNAQHSQLRSQADAIATNRQLIINTWTTSLENAHGQIERAQARIDAASAALDAATAYEAETRTLLEGGAAAQTDLITAVTNRSQRELDLEQALFYKRMALLTAFYCAGTELQDLEAK